MITQRSGIGIVAGNMGIPQNIGAQLPPQAGPICLRCFICAQHVDVCLSNAECKKRGKALTDQRPPRSLSAMLRMDDQMLQIASPSVMPAHHTPHKALTIHGNETQARIALQVTLCCRLGIGVAHGHAWRGCHQRKYQAMVFQGHWTYLDQRHLLVAKGRPPRLVEVAAVKLCCGWYRQPKATRCQPPGPGPRNT